MVVPFAAGSTSDLIGRILAERLSDAFGKKVVVENRGGAGGSIAAEYVARATPDGYTLLFGTIATHGINPAIYQNLRYDPSPISCPSHNSASLRTSLSCPPRCR